MAAEEACGALPVGADGPPEAFSAHLVPWAVEAEHRPLGVFGPRAADPGFDLEPVAHGCDRAEGDARLRHSEGPGVHAEEDDPLARSAVAFQVGRVGSARVGEGVVDVGNGAPEAQASDAPLERAGWATSSAPVPF